MNNNDKTIVTKANSIDTNPTKIKKKLDGIETLFIDIDGTLINTIQTICDLYNEDYKYYKNFKPVEWWKVDSWGFNELTLASRDNINLYFNQPRFFQNIQYMPWSQLVMNELMEHYNVKIVSMGDYPNLKMKQQWVANNFNCEFIGVDFKDCSDKSLIDMANGVLIDDSINMLNTCNANIKICFGDIYSWNKDWKGQRLTNWMDIRNYFLESRDE